MSEVKQSGANLLSRRNFLRGVGTVGVGAMLAACAAPGGAPASGGEWRRCARCCRERD